MITGEATAVASWKSIDDRRARWLPPWRKACAAVLTWELDTVVLPQAARAASVGQAVALVEQALPASRERWEAVIAQLYGHVGEDFARTVHVGLKAQLVKETKADWERLLRDGGLSAGSEAWVRLVADWLAVNAGTRITKIEGTTLALLRDELEKAARDGLSIPQTAVRLRTIAPEFTALRATMIARTEIIAASNLGARAGAIATGRPLNHVWIATPGPRTRPSHISANGQTRDVNEPFQVGGQSLMFPGDSSLGASAWNLVNCRCSIGFRPK